jgi:glycerol-3-phosphate acyltransferase PlsY
MLILLRIVCLLIGYGFGLLQAGFLVGKIYNVDIRQEGSGNSGTTNAMRVLGVRAGLITFFVDALKCVAAILLVQAFWGENESFMLLAVYTGFGVTLGHNFPFYMNFKGGKGIAAMSGLVITIGLLTSPWIIIVPAFAFFSCAILTRFVSLGSLQVSVLFFLMIVFYGQLGGFAYMSFGNRIELYLVVFLLAALAWYRHLDNIKRLLKGEENRFGVNKNEKKENEDE